MRHSDTALAPVLHTVSGKRTLCGAPNVKRSTNRPLPLCAECQHILRLEQPTQRTTTQPVNTYRPSDHEPTVVHSHYFGQFQPAPRYRR